MHVCQRKFSNCWLSAKNLAFLDIFILKKSSRAIAMLLYLWVVLSARLLLILAWRYSKDETTLEAVVRRCFVKKVLLEISQNSHFPVNFGKFLRTPFFIEHLWWCLFQIKSKQNNFSNSTLNKNKDFSY